MDQALWVRVEETDVAAVGREDGADERRVSFPALHRGGVGWRRVYRLDADAGMAVAQQFQLHAALLGRKLFVELVRAGSGRT